jgi:4,5-dihydroxyphthalate decarboxylase
MADIQLTLACGDYEITRALQEGSIKPDGINLTVLTDLDSTTRHWRFLRNREFDVAEVSASSYLLARDADHPFDGIPVFLHRRFRHEFVFVNTSKGIRTPKDLIGRKVGVKSFQASAILWMRGILEHEYGVPHKSIDWYSELDEDVEFVPPPGLRLTKLPEDASLEDMLVKGELDAVLHTDLIDPYVDGNPAVARLFDDYKAEEIAFYKKTKIFPIMHVMGMKREIVERYPWAPIELYKAFEKAKLAGMKRMFNPRVAPLAWYRDALQEQEDLLGKDPWEYGLTPKNMNNLNTLIGYSHEQGMLKRKPTLDELFLDMSQGRKRGTHRV